MSFKLPMENFKKVSEDNHKTVLRHSDGHEITIAHKALSNKMRSQLKALPMSDAPVKQTEVTLKAEKGLSKIPVEASMNSGAASQSMPMAEGGETLGDKIGYPKDSGMAKGGIAPSPKLDDSMKNNPKLEESKKLPKKMADGGEPTEPNTTASPTPKKDPTKGDPEYSGLENNSNPVKRNDVQSGLAKSFGFADGGDVTPMPDTSDAQPGYAQHIGTVIGHAVRAAVGDTAQAVKNVASPVMAGAKGLVKGLVGSSDDSQEPAAPSTPPVDPQLAQASKDLAALQSPSVEPDQSQQTAPQIATSGQPSSDSVPQPTDLSPIEGLPTQDQPSLEAGYAKQMQGIQGIGQAQANQGALEARAIAKPVAAESQALATFQKNEQDLNRERQNFIQDIQNGHIDPEHYWADKDTGDRIKTGLGLILGGIGSGLTGGPNIAAQNLQNNINRDIDAQKANLGKKQSLLEANLHQYGNMRDAVDATRIMLGDVVTNQLHMAAAKAQSPLAKAAAIKAAGDLQSSMAPGIYKFNMYRTLQSMGQNGGGSAQGGNPNLSHVDPAVFIQSLVPEPQQKNVSDEISRAQDTRNMAQQIMQNFDQASQDIQGVGRAEALVKEPRSALALKQALQPTFKDLEGTVRQAAMENTFHNVTPTPADTARDLQIKRNALQQYILSKSSAPLAKSYGIDLNKFASTNATPESRLNPQQASWVQWAKSNPNDPRAAIVLKKLGIQ